MTRRTGLGPEEREDCLSMTLPLTLPLPLTLTLPLALLYAPPDYPLY